MLRHPRKQSFQVEIEDQRAVIRTAENQNSIHRHTPRASPYPGVPKSDFLSPAVLNVSALGKAVDESIGGSFSANGVEFSAVCKTEAYFPGRSSVQDFETSKFALGTRARLTAGRIFVSTLTRMGEPTSRTRYMVR
jgi:hypothetical protein